MTIYTALYYDGNENQIETSSGWDNPEEYREEIQKRAGGSTVIMIIEGDPRIWWPTSYQEEPLTEILRNNSV